MEQPSGPSVALLGKRKSNLSDESNNSQHWDSTSTSYSAYCNTTPGYASPGYSTKRNKQQADCCQDDQYTQQHFWVWDHCMQQQPTPGAQLQPADSSTGQGLVAATQLLQQADPMDYSMADSKQGLVRTTSAPELVKLAQADSAAWHAQHQHQQQAAFLSHQDYWLT